MNQNVLETITGAVVLLAAIYFLVFAVNQTQSITTAETYQLVAEFDKVGDLSVGSDVRVSGIKIGSVRDLHLDPGTYNAIATLEIEQTVELPLDSSARIESAGLLGGNYLALIPGAEMDMMIDGDRIEYTQGAIGLMDIVSQALFSSSQSATESQ